MAFHSPLATSQHFGHAAGREVPLFQPPKSPASVAASPAFATADDYFTGSRKRQRGQSTHATQSFYAETPSWSQCPTPGDRIFDSAFGQNSGLVNERYRLQGGFDTPSLESTSRPECHHAANEHDFRRRLRDEDMGNTLRTDETPIFGPLARERNGVARIALSPDVEPSKTWTNTAFGLVGKVFTFGTSMIRGFYSGGGQGYDLKNYPLVGSDLLQESASRDYNHTPIPGSWHQDEFLGDFEQDSPAFAAGQNPAERPQNKRRQTDRDTWVVVGTPDVQDAPLSPRRKISSNTVPRSSLAGTRPTASRASSRRSIAPTPRRAGSSVAANGSPALHFTSPAPFAQSQNRRASIAPMRSPQGGRSSSANSGLTCMSPEAERYAKRQAKQDKAISSMGRRMEDLIRQAHEALGTKISIEGDGMDEDEGFVDDDW